MKKIKTYVIKFGNTDFYKIGKTTNISRRLQNLKTGTPLDLQIVYLFNGDVEKKMHRELRKYRVIREFYKLTREQISILKDFNKEE
jgi:hypothetical protein